MAQSTDAPPVTEPPIFVGGTGRSGTTIVARLLGRGPTYATLSRELKFHCHPGGLTDLLDGDTDLAAFTARLRDRWWGADPPPGASGGFMPMCAPQTFEPAVAAFAATFSTAPLEAARRLVCEIADPFAQRRLKRGWVEHTTTTVRDAGRLQRLFPQLRVVHVMRDGRDVAASLLQRDWGPDTPIAALHYWADRFAASVRGSRDLPADRVHVVAFEDLVLHDREVQFAALMRFAGITDDQDAREFFDTVMTADAAHIGRWRQLPQAAALDVEYRRVLQRRLDDGAVTPQGVPPVEGRRPVSHG